MTRFSAVPVLFWILPILALALAVPVIGSGLSDILWSDPSVYDPERLVFLHATLPRLAMALLCGGALGASGAILQQALRNPIASPTTLGIDAGARLALALATLMAPSLIGAGRDLVALLGSGTAMLLVFALTRRQGFAAVPLVLAGLVVSLYCGALAAILVLVNDRYLVSLFIWGGGSLSQQSWQPALSLALRLALLAPVALILVRPLALFDIGETGARALGLPVTAVRAGAVALAVALAAFVTSAVGVIGFVGLVAPVLAGLMGIRSFGARLGTAILLGALLLLVTDLSVQRLAGTAADLLPTGAVTAVLGSPLLLWLLPRLPRTGRPPLASGTRLVEGLSRQRLVIVAAICAAVFLCALLLGRTPDGGWAILTPDLAERLLPLRGPRVLAAIACGAMLGVAGFVLQRLTGNEMASPEILGISAGATFAVAIGLFAGLALGIGSSFALSVAGSLVILALILAFARGDGFSPERMLLAGVSLNALLDAAVGLLSVTGDPRAVQLLSMMGGSMSGLTGTEATAAAGLCLFVLMAGLLAARWLAILPLGAPASLALGLPVPVVRLLLVLLVAAATAVATPLVGPLTFIGLMAPHLVRLAGLHAPHLALPATAVAGALILTGADFAARVAAFPFQLPTGLVAALVGAPFLLFLLQTRKASA